MKLEYINAQAQKTEALINSCLVDRIQSEKRFAALGKVLAKNL